MQGTRFVGDLSRADMQVLAEHAMRYDRILEFGAGASTQILASRGRQGSALVCVETESLWVDRTREHLRRLATREPVFLSWEKWEEMNQSTSRPTFDLIFNDGLDRLRMDFGLRAWPMLGEGGVMLWHDCRQPHIVERALDLVRRFHEEVESVVLSLAGSNMAALKKRISLPYEHWGENERLRSGHVAVNPAHLGMTKDDLLNLRAQMERGTW
jgi:predicted O-methyltransferase YrrM